MPMLFLSALGKEDLAIVPVQAFPVQESKLPESWFLVNGNMEFWYFFSTGYLL